MEIQTVLGILFGVGGTGALTVAVSAYRRLKTGKISDDESIIKRLHRELIEDLFGRDLPGAGAWQVGGCAVRDQLSVPLLNVTADRDRIAPAATAANGERLWLPSGHVGMIVGSVRVQLHEALKAALTPCR